MSFSVVYGWNTVALHSSIVSKFSLLLQFFIPDCLARKSKLLFCNFLGCIHWYYHIIGFFHYKSEIYETKQKLKDHISMLFLVSRCSTFFSSPLRIFLFAFYVIFRIWLYFVGVIGKSMSTKYFWKQKP